MFQSTQFLEEQRIRAESTAGLIAIGVSPHDARQMVSEAVESAKGKVSQPFGPPMGLRVLQMEREGRLGAPFDQVMPVARRDGVTDEDIRFYWDLVPLERAVDRMLCDASRMAALLTFMEQDEQYRRDHDQTAATQRATVHVRKTLPLFGDPREPIELSPSDRFLPWELRRRVTMWSLKHQPLDPTVLEQSTTLNALVRRMIREGRL